MYISKDTSDSGRGFDGKTLRETKGERPTVDYHSAIVRMLENRVGPRRPFTAQPHPFYDVLKYPSNTPGPDLPLRLAKSVTNKQGVPTNCLSWSPKFNYVVTGNDNGELTLWDGMKFNFKTIISTSNNPIRTMQWDLTERLLLIGDAGGSVKFCDTNYSCLKSLKAHEDSVNDLSLSPFGDCFVTCSDDNTLRLWNFYTQENISIMSDHGSQVTCVDWNPTSSLLVSGSRDSNRNIMLWDARTSAKLNQLYSHKQPVNDVSFNKDGRHFISASKDHSIRLFDTRNLSSPVMVYRDQKCDIHSLTWNQQFGNLFASGGYNGSIYYWDTERNDSTPFDCLEKAHQKSVKCLAWSPFGNLLASCSHDHSTRFWTALSPSESFRPTQRSEEASSINVFDIPGLDLPSEHNETMAKQDSEEHKELHFDTVERSNPLSYSSRIQPVYIHDDVKIPQKRRASTLNENPNKRRAIAGEPSEWGQNQSRKLYNQKFPSSLAANEAIKQTKPSFNNGIHMPNTRSQIQANVNNNECRSQPNHPMQISQQDSCPLIPHMSFKPKPYYFMSSFQNDPRPYLQNSACPEIIPAFPKLSINEMPVHPGMPPPYGVNIMSTQESHQQIQSMPPPYGVNIMPTQESHQQIQSMPPPYFSPFQQVPPQVAFQQDLRRPPPRFPLHNGFPLQRDFSRHPTMHQPRYFSPHHGIQRQEDFSRQPRMPFHNITTSPFH